MSEENKQNKTTESPKVEEKKAVVVETKTEAKTESPKVEEKKTKNKPIIKKEEAVAKGVNLKASKKHCMYICSFIKNKPIDLAIKQLEEVTIQKRVIPFKGEIPHRSAPGIMSGRSPVAASKEMIYVLKALKGNVLVNGMDLDKTRITFGSASWASRPAKKGGARFKRTFVLLKAKEISGDKK